MQKQLTAMWRSTQSVRPQPPACSSRRTGLLQTQVSRLKTLLGRYDAATTTLDNARHWAAADGLSASAANSPEVRRTLRNRSRYEIANNSYARGISLTLANDCVGTGPRLQMLTRNDRANDYVEKEFQAWTHEIGLAEKLRTMRLARVSDGESFGLLTTNPRIDSPVQLDLKLVEAEQVTSPSLQLDRGRYIDGIQLDEYGNAIAAQVLDDGLHGWRDATDRLAVSRRRGSCRIAGHTQVAAYLERP